MVLCVGCGSCVSLFGERERAAKRPGRREACERARRCARRTRGEGKRSTDVCESSGRAAVRAAGIGIRAPPGDFSQARTRSRLAARAQISARTRSARRVPTVDRSSSCHTLRSNSTGRTHASTRLRRRAHLARSAKGPHKTQPWCVHGRRARVRSGRLATRLARSGRVASSRARAHRPNERLDRTSPAREPSRPRPRRRRVASRSAHRSIGRAASAV
jgi:hypothetical protein